MKAINSAGTSEQSNYVNVETPAAPQPAVPSAPTGLTASSVSHDSITLAWDDPADDSITGYQVLRRSRDGDDYGDGQGDSEFAVVVEDIGSATTTHTDTTVTARTRYVYRVRAINPEGMSDRSGYLNVETAGQPTIEPTTTPSVPGRPTGLTSTSVSHDSVTLEWDEPGDDSITGYQVLRRNVATDPVGSFAILEDDTGSATTTYIDATVTSQTHYAYRVKARNAVGLSERSSRTNVETPDKPDASQLSVNPRQSLSTDATLSEITVDGTAVPGFSSSRTSYEYGVAHDTVQVTIAATTTDANATWSVRSPADTDDMTDGHQVDLSAGRNTVRIRGTAQATSTTQDYTLRVNRGVDTDYGWRAADDFDTLVTADNLYSRGIWSDGTTMWVADSTDNEVYAYTLSTKRRDSGKDIDLPTVNNEPYGIWSDGTTMWVVDATDTKLYAYNLSTRARDDTRDIDLHSSNGHPTGIWSDGTTMWVVDREDTRLYAYNLSTKMRDEIKDIALAQSGRSLPNGVWSDGTTIWVSDIGDDKIYAYRLLVRSRDADREFNTLSRAGNNWPTGIWSDGTTMWVVDREDDKVYSYNMPLSNVTLGGLSVDGTAVPGFAPSRTSYEYGVASTVARVTIAATSTNSEATWEITSPADADDITDGHQVDLSDGQNTVTIRGTAQDTTTRDYTLNVNRGVTTPYGWKAVDDIDTLIASGNRRPQDVWANDSRVWVLDSQDKRIYVYDRSTGLLDSTITLDSSFRSLAAIWSDGTHVWVANGSGTSVNLAAYDLSTGARASGQDFTGLGAAGNTNPFGLWSDGIHLWVADRQDDRAYAYDIFTKAHDSSRDISIAGLWDESETDPSGAWSDGATIWIIAAFSDDPLTTRIRAFNANTKIHDSSKDIDIRGVSGTGPKGLWSDGRTMWVADSGNDKVYSFNIPVSDDATLRSLSVSPRDVIGFEPDRASYEVGVASSVTQATVAATASHRSATVSITPADASSDDGHQVDLSAGQNTVTITVTAEDATSTQAYTVNINRGVATTYGWKASDDFDGLKAAGSTLPIGIWSDGTTMWVAFDTDDRIYAYNTDGTHNPSQDFDTLSRAGNHHPRGIWSDAQTMWVADDDDNKLYAYTMSTRAHDSGKDIDLHADNDRPRGVWSDGTTMWVSDVVDNKLYAYTLADGNPDSGKDIDLHTDNSDPYGITSDGYTMWVGDDGDIRLFAYSLSTKARNPNAEFSTALHSAGNTSPRGLWSDDETVWVADRAAVKVYSYNKPSADATLSDLSVDGRPVPGFSAGRTSYEYGVASTVAQVTIAATTTDGDATWLVSSHTDVSSDPGHQVALPSTGRNTITVRGTAQDGGTTRDYTLNVNRSATTSGGWAAHRDMDWLIGTDNRGPRGIWANSSTVYIADFGDEVIYAYSRDGTPDTGRDIDVQTDNNFPNGIWSDGQTVWVADSGLASLHAYTLADGGRDSTADVDLGESSRGVWGNETTVWAVNTATDKLEAYWRSSGDDNNSRDIDLDTDNDKPAGIWSDGETMWVADYDDHKLYAYELSDGDRKSSKDIDTSVTGNEDPRGLWGDGRTVWVTDDDDDKVYAYNLPPSDDAELRALAVSPRDIIGFHPDRRFYHVGVASTVTQATVIATPSNAGATVAYSVADADDVADGHQVALAAGRNPVVVTVTATNATSTEEYTVRINRGVDTIYGWKAADDLDGLRVSGNNNPIGIWSDGTTTWVSDWSDRRLYAYNADGTRNSDQDFTSLRGSSTNGPRNMWSDGTTMWVSYKQGGRLYAYSMSTKARDDSRNIDLHADNDSPRGLWSDGATIWVVDNEDHKLYAYNLSTKAHATSSDFTLHADNSAPRGIWSNGVTMWVSDSHDEKVYAYRMSDQSRDSDQDFDTLDEADNTEPTGLWSDGTTMWAVDNTDEKVYSYNMPSPDATLGALSVSPKDIIGFESDRTSYEVGVASTVTQVTVTATTSHPAATNTFSGTDASTDPGHQIALSAGRNEVTVTVTAENMSTTEEYTVSINRGVTADYGWKAADDLDGLIAAGNRNPYFIWSDGTTVWVVDPIDKRLYAYNADGTRNAGQDFDTLDAAGNDDPRGIWSDGTTMWVADSSDTKLYAYSMSTKAHDTGRDIDLHSDNGLPTGIWSDGTTVWVADSRDIKLYAYTLSTKARDRSKEFGVAVVAVSLIGGIWSDGFTMWVVDRYNDQLHAFRLFNGQRLSARDFSTLSDAGNGDARGIWSDGDTLWVVDHDDEKVYSYNMPPSADARLGELTVSPRDVIGFRPERTDYEVGVASTVTQATLNATTSHSEATISFSTMDDDDMTDGHQIALSAGRNEVTITVAAEDTTFTEEYTVSINRGVTTDYGWKASDDLDGLKAAGNNRPTGIWSDGTTTWVLDSSDTILYAYTTSTGARDSDRDIDLHSDNARPTDVWSDGTTVWVVDTADNKLFAYNLSSKTRDSGKDIALHSDNTSSLGVWSDGTTVWVVDTADNKLFAYDLSSTAHDSDKDIALHSDNVDATDIWSDGLTMWVADSVDNKLFAYRVFDKVREMSRDFDTLSGAGNNNPLGIWSDGETMWVTDTDDDKVYSYNMPPSRDASLIALTVSPRDIIGFRRGRTSYEVGVASTVTQATVTATMSHPDATASTTPADASTDEGHQVDLTAGRNTVTVTVTAEDPNATRSYTVNINRGVDTAYGWKASDDFDGLKSSGMGLVTSPWSDGQTMWVGSDENDKIYAYNPDGTHNPGQDFDTLAGVGNNNPVGIWSDGTTMWVSDSADNRLYAYMLSSKARVEGREFGLDPDNGEARGIWSDGTTVWVADSADNKLYAYTLAGGNPDSDRDIDLDSANDNPYGITSDGITMWVADATDKKLYAYTISTKARDSDRDFGMLDAADNDTPRGVWTDGITMWVADLLRIKVFSYNMPLSSDATLSALSVSPRDLIGFDPDRTLYEVGLASTVSQATVTAAASYIGATVSYSGTDADDMTDSHQVNLSDGRNTVFVRVRATDGTTKEYTVRINRSVTTPYGWRAADDLDGLKAAENDIPYGIWSDGATTWVADWEDGKIYAYNADGTRNSSQDFDTLAAAGNEGPRGIWSDGTTMWVSDSHDNKLYAYSMSTKAHDSGRDITTHSDNADSNGLWSDGTTIWVADPTDNRLFAYNLSSRVRDDTRDIDLHSDNAAAVGIWADSTTMWVSDDGDNKLFAYRMNGNRVSSRDFNTLSGAGNTDPAGIWSDGTVMRVVDGTDGKVYSFNMPPSDDNRLSTLTVSPRDIIGFRSGRTSYEVGVANSVDRATVTASAAHPAARVAYSGTDADSAPGHQVDLSAGRNPVTITVTAEDSSTRTYTVTINRGVTTPGGWKAADDLDGLITAGNTSPTDIWSDGTTIWVADDSEDRLYAYNRDGTPDPGRNLDLHTDNGRPLGIWSDGTTIWVSDYDDNKLYAYTLATKARDSGKDISLTTDNTNATGLWSDGTTIWVADGSLDRKLYAYTLSTRAHDSSRDIDLHVDNANPRSLWSDGTTMWVLEVLITDRIFAYRMSDESRNRDLEFHTLDATGITIATGIWSDGRTMWVVAQDDDKVYSFNMFFGPVTDLRSTPGNGLVMLAWNTPADSTPTRYQYRVSADGGASWNPDWSNIPGSNASTTSYAVTGLTNGTEHTLQLRPIYSQGGREVQGPEVGVRSIPRGLLRAPRNLTAAPTTDGAIALAWDDPGDASITGHQYRHRSPSDSDWNPNWTAVPGSDPATTTHTLTGLTNFVLYTFEVRAVRDGSTFGPPARRQATPRGPLVAPANLAAETGQDRRVTLTWDRSNDDSITAYQYRYRNTADTGWNPDWTTMPGSNAGTAARILTGLSNNLLYTIEIRAVRGSILGPSSRQTATPRGPLIAPPNLEAESGRDEQIALSWDSVGDAAVSGFQYRYRNTSDTGWNPDWTDISGGSATTTSYTLTGLSNNLLYTIEVRVVRDGTGGPPSRRTATPRGPLVAPANLAAETGQDRRVTLTWDRSNDDSITAYQYRYRNTADTGWNPDWTTMPGSNANTAARILTGLSNNLLYTIEIRAMRGTIEGPSSRQTATPRGPLIAPPNLAAESGRDEQIALSWDSVGDAAVSGFQYRYRNTSDTGWNPDWTDISGSNATTTSHTLTGLTNNLLYTIEVRVVRDGTGGPPSRRTATPRGPLVAPPNFEAESGRDRRVALSWDNVGDDSITVFRYRYRASSETDWDPDWTDVPGSRWDTTSYTVRGLLNNTAYTFEIRPMRGNLEGPAATAAATPRGPLVVPPNFDAESNQDRQISLTWDSTGDDSVTVFRYRHRNTSDTGWNPDWTDIPGSGPNTTSHTLTGLTNYLAYTIEVRAMRGSIEGPVARDSATPRGPLVAPPGFAAASGQDERVTLTWESTGDDSITSYQYRHRVTSAGSWDPDWTAIPRSRWNTTSYVVTGLLNRATYTFEVRPMRGSIEGPAATATATPEGPPVAPGAPRDLTLFVDDGGLYVVWTPPGFIDPRAPVTSYRMRHRQQGTSRWTTVSQSRMIGTIDGLTNRRHYEVQVAAVNSVGTGAWASAIGTPQAPPQPPPEQPPTPLPTGEQVNLPGLGVGALAARWTDVYGSDARHPDSVDMNPNVLSNSCSGMFSFRVSWATVADDYQAHVTTRYGAGEFSHEFRPEPDDPDHVSMHGRVSLEGDASLTVVIRSYHTGQGWGTWSSPVGLHCSSD